MPYTYLPQDTYLRINGDKIEMVFTINDNEIVASTMTAEQARSNASDLLDAADKLEGKGRWAK